MFKIEMWIQYQGRGPLIYRKKEFLQKKADAEKMKIDQLTKDISSGQLTDTIAQMKAMNLDDHVVKKVQENLESNARESVREIQGVVGYETYD